MSLPENRLSYRASYVRDQDEDSGTIQPYLQEPHRSLSRVVITDDSWTDRYRQTHYEMHLDQVDTLRKYHFWRYKAVLYMVIVLFAISWLHHLTYYAMDVENRHRYLVEQGEPLECRQAHGEGNWVYDFVFRDSDRRACEDYRLELSQTDRWWLFPDLFLVTTDTLMYTIIHPFQAMCKVFYELPYLLQTSLCLVATALLGLYVVTRNIELRWFSSSSGANTTTNQHNLGRTGFDHQMTLMEKQC